LLYPSSESEIVQSVPCGPSKLPSAQISDRRGDHSPVLGAQLDVVDKSQGSYIIRSESVSLSTFWISLPLLHYAPPPAHMSRIFPLFFFISLTIAADNPNFWNVQLTSDSSQRYMVNAQMASLLARFFLGLLLTSQTSSRPPVLPHKTSTLCLQPAHPL
jgi:hypothetical protein